MNQIAQLFVKIKGDNTDLKSKLNETKSQLGGVGDAFQKMTGISLTSAGLISAGIGLAVKGVQELIKYYNEGKENLLAYADAVETFANSSGLATDAAQEWVIMAQRLDVSQSALAKGMRELSLNGIAPTIDNVAKLADEYRALEDPTEKATFLQKNFKQSGVELGKMFVLTGTQLKELNAEIKNSSLLTEGQIQAINNLEDAEARYQIAKETRHRQAVAWWLEIETWWKNERAASTERYNELYYQQQLINEALEGELITKQQIKDLGWYGVLDLIAEKNAEAAQGYLDAKNALNDWMISVGMIPANMEPVAASLSETTQYFREMTKEMLFNVAAEGLSSTAALALAQSMGLVNDNTLAAITQTEIIRQLFLDGKITAEQYTDIIANLADNLDRIHSRDAYVNIYTTEYRRTIQGDWGPGQAQGDWRPPEQTAAGGSFIVPQRYGYEGFNMGGMVTASGGERVTVSPRDETQQGTHIDQRDMIELAQVLKNAVLEAKG